MKLLIFSKVQYCFYRIENEGFIITWSDDEDRLKQRQFFEAELQCVNLGRHLEDGYQELVRQEHFHPLARIEGFCFVEDNVTLFIPQETRRMHLPNIPKFSSQNPDHVSMFELIKKYSWKSEDWFRISDISLTLLFTTFDYFLLFIRESLYHPNIQDAGA